MKSEKLFENLKTQLSHPYSLRIRNEENLAEEGRMRFTIGGLAAFFLVFVALFFATVYFTASRLGQSGFRDAGLTIENRKLMAKIASKTDSLDKEVIAYASYYANLKSILETGKGTYTGSQSSENDSLKVKINDSVFQSLNPNEQALREAFESGKTQDLLTVVPEENQDISKMILFKPVEGLLTSSFDQSIGHYGIDLVSKKNEPVKSISSGTVILSSWTADEGYMITVQHQHNIISVYKHNSSLIRKAGDKVVAGEIIAIMGNSGEHSTGPHLHFEIWQDGKPIDPALYLTFN